MREFDLSAPTIDFEGFASREWAELVRFAALLTGDLGHAEDLVQTALIRLGAHWGSAQRSPSAYVRTILLNLARNRWRDRARRREVPLPENLATLGTAGGTASEESIVIGAALSTLAPRQRQLLVLYYYADLSVDEIAAITRTAVGTVKSTLSDGRRALSRMLEDSWEVETNA